MTPKGKTSEKCMVAFYRPSEGEVGWVSSEAEPEPRGENVS